MPKKVLAIDPEALIFTTAAYIKLHLPDPPDIAVAQIREAAQAMSPRERAAALKQVEAALAYAKVWKRALSSAG